MKKIVKALVIIVFCFVPFGLSQVKASSPFHEDEPVGIMVHPDASEPSEAKGTLTENVDANNQDYVIGSNDTPNRQFVTFTSKSGKVFHLIINHDKDNEQVQLLTEVSEQDLLNMIESKQAIPIQPQKVDPVEKEEHNEKKSVPKESSGSFILLFLIVATVLGIGYYIKVIKPKSEHNFEEFEETEDFISEEEDENWENNT